MKNSNRLNMEIRLNKALHGQSVANLLYELIVIRNLEWRSPNELPSTTVMGTSYATPISLKIIAEAESESQLAQHQELKPCSKVICPLCRTRNQCQPVSGKTSLPPQLAVSLLNFFVYGADRDNMLGDLDEKFSKLIERHGVRIARFLYLKDACTTVYPAILKLLAKIGVITGAGKLLRHIRFW